jgi:ribonuclease HI
MLKTTPLKLLQREAGLLNAEDLLDYKQQCYALRALSKPKGHPTNSILPSTFRYGELDAQPGQYSSGNLDWTYDKPQKSLGKHLAKQLASRLRVNSEAGFEATYSNLPRFTGQVVIKEPKKAKDEALLEYPEDLVIFTDGAKQERAGAGLVWQLPYRADLFQRSIPLGEGKEALDAELYAIKEALLLAKREARQATSIRIFTDSQRALRLLQCSSTEGSDTLEQIQRIVNKLTRVGKHTTLYWTPGHQDIPRNCLADQAAKDAANQYSRDSTISLLHVKKTLQRKYRLEPLNPSLLKGKRGLVTRYLQLKSGHAIKGSNLLNTFSLAAKNGDNQEKSS